MLTMPTPSTWLKCCTSVSFAVCFTPTLCTMRVNLIMQKVSQSSKPRFRLAHSLRICAGVVGFALYVGANAGGTFPAVSQTGSSQGIRATEPTGFGHQPTSEERSSLRHALGSGAQPSGSEKRSLRSSEERRALMQDLRNATRDMSGGGDTPN